MLDMLGGGKGPGVWEMRLKPFGGVGGRPVEGRIGDSIVGAEGRSRGLRNMGASLDCGLEVMGIVEALEDGRPCSVVTPRMEVREF